MRNFSLVTLLLIICFFSQNAFSQVSIKSGGSISATIPSSATDQLRVDKGTFSQRVSGTVGQFSVSDQWIRTGMPSSDNYGTRTQWSQQALINYLSKRPGTVIKDAIIGWGNQGGEMQFRYLKDTKSYLKVLSLTSQGNVYIGWRDTVTFSNPKFMINANNQLAFAIKDSNTTAASIINILSNSDAYAVTPSLDVQSVSKTGFGRTDGILSTATGANVNVGVNGIAIEGTNFNVGVNGQAIDARTNGLGVQGVARGPNNNYGIYGVAFGGVANYAGYFEGDVYTTGMYTGSDKKLKRDIKQEESMIDKIKSLKPVFYNFKTTEFKSLNLPKTGQHGFIAQDVKEIFPEMVTTIRRPSQEVSKNAADNEFLAINYTMFIPVLTKGLQEQQKQIEEQKVYNQQLERRIADLENALLKADNLKVKEDYEGLKNVTIDQNVPNPFNQKTTISYNIPTQVSNASVTIFDLTGKLLLQYDNLKGKSQIAIEGNKLSAGMYIYTLLVGGKEITSKKMILTK